MAGHGAATVAALAERVLPRVDIERALLRGRYLLAVAAVESQGVPVDRALLHRLRADWPEILAEVCRQRDIHGLVVDGCFREDRFETWLARSKLVWPLHPSGRPVLNDDAFAEVAASSAEVAEIRELRRLVRGAPFSAFDEREPGRLFAALRPFGTVTGRNAPSSTKFILNAPSWTRALVRPPAGRALAYLDWRSHELGIAAVLSEDANLLRSYEADDPYLEFARLAGVRIDGLAADERQRVRCAFKACALGQLYGMGTRTLARKAQLPLARAEDLVARHQAAFRRFWDWSQAQVDAALFERVQTSTFGWARSVEPDTSEPSLMNFPMQANGAEMLRLALIFADNDGVDVVGLHHDALLLEAKTDLVDDCISVARGAMRRASELVLNGYRLGIEERKIFANDHFDVGRGARTWGAIQDVLAQASHLSRGRHGSCAADACPVPSC